MKLNIAYPPTGQQKVVEIEDEKILFPFIEKTIGAEVPGDCLGNNFKGYVFKITGGNDKQGFPMLQGVLVNHRVRLLFRKGMKCYRPRRTGEMKRKSVRGCIVGNDLAALALIIVKKGPQDIEGLTDKTPIRRLGPKRAMKIRKMFALDKKDDVRKFVVRRKIENKPNKDKAPKIQRLITPERLYRKKKVRAFRRNKAVQSRIEFQEFAKNKYVNMRDKCKSNKAARVLKHQQTYRKSAQLSRKATTRRTQRILRITEKKKIIQVKVTRKIEGRKLITDM